MRLTDSSYLLVLLGLSLGLIAQAAVKRAWQEWSKVPTRGGRGAGDVAMDMLHRQGNFNVTLKPVQGELTDNYDPRNETLNLSGGVYDSHSVAALGIAAHEAGHAMQKYTGYALLSLRSSLVPTVNIGSRAAWPIFLVGILASLQPLMWAGILLFSLSVLFSLITLPMELDASRRGLNMLREGGYMTEDELAGARKVLRSAAFTYVASAIASVLNLVRLIMIANGSRSRRR